ncbi:MAG: exodeoxyribonuclease VII large subunit [Candidatus Omnitrophota bacterium]
MALSKEESRHIFTVSEITEGIKSVLSEAFSQVWVEGEISNLRISAAGHLYPSLKDGNAVLQTAIFKGTAKDIKFKLEDGLKVICFGRIEVYPPRGSYQLIIEKIEPKGVGELQLALEQLKKKLEKEGLFSLEHKRPIPYLPSTIGIATSLTGAAIKDILKVLDRRFKDVRIILSPVRVQGEGAKEEIARAINDFNLYNQSVTGQDRIEVMIVGRGGGSVEDLWVFNEEIVARAIFNSNIPVISAVGHERDWTIADLVADYRAATPSVAAEVILPKKEDLKFQLSGLVADLGSALDGQIENFRGVLEDFAHRLYLSLDHVLELNINRYEAGAHKLFLLNPATQLKIFQERIADLARQSGVRLGHILEIRQARFSRAAARLSGLSPLNVLSRGYSITFKLPGGEVVRDAARLKPGDIIRSRLRKGEITSEIKEVDLDN